MGAASASFLPRAVAKSRQRALEAPAISLYLYSKELAMLAVRLSEKIEKRLERLAARTGRTKTFYAREAIEAYLDDLEDFYLAEERLRDFRSEDAISLDELKAELGLDN
jgi:RHH-type transcriptional regulator, rel operon repressor / antitoxin RelB